MTPFSPVFRRSLEAIPVILKRKFGFPETGNPNLSASFYTSRDAIVRAIEETGDPKNVLPFIGIKLSTVYLDVESYNPRLLKRDGLPLYYSPAELAEDQITVMTFFGRPVRVEAEAILFTDNYDQLISVIEQIMFSGSELHFKLRIGEGTIPIKFSLEKESISVPEADFTTEAFSNFELSFQLSVKTYSGFIEPVPLVKRVKIQGGSSIQYETLDGKTKTRVDRLLASGFGVDERSFVDDMGIIEFNVGLDTDIIDPTDIKET